MLGRIYKRSKKLGNRGDTIIEIMIVLSVLGFAIGVTYATANRSLLNVRQAEESTEATTLVQSQIESLRTLTQYTVGQPNDIFDQTTPGFCIDSSGNVQTITNSGPTDQASYPASCLIDNLYYLFVSYEDPTTSTFEVQAVWADVLGQGEDSVTMFYRIYQPS
jgi:type II secretory pathway pseudopilin PulG